MWRFPFSAVLLVFLLPFFLSQPCQAMKGVNPDGSLDKTTLSKAYFEGEFWTVITALEEYRKKGLASGTRDDSVYTYKYLSVVYAADSTTRHKAESFMYILLRMMPTIDLLDLYISDNIESIFQKVRSDFERMQKLTETKAEIASPDSAPPTVVVHPTAVATRTDSAAQEPPVAVKVQPPEKHHKRKVKPWVLAALGGGVAATVATYFIVANGDDNSDNSTRTWEPRFNPPQQ